MRNGTSNNSYVGGRGSTKILQSDDGRHSRGRKEKHWIDISRSRHEGISSSLFVFYLNNCKANCGEHTLKTFNLHNTLSDIPVLISIKSIKSKKVFKVKYLFVQQVWFKDLLLLSTALKWHRIKDLVFSFSTNNLWCRVVERTVRNGTARIQWDYQLALWK